MNIESEQISRILSIHLSPILIIGFGSYWKGTSRTESDIDIAVFAKDPISPLDRYRIAQEISHTLNRDVDLIDLRQTNTIFKEQIIRTGIYLWERNASDRALFESEVLLDSFALKDERKIILDRLKEEGTLF
jgi:uncharacterized protein